MQVLSWNANCKFREKFEAVASLDWDVLVIQECENPRSSNDLAYQEWAKNYFWVGNLHYKGLGVFLANDLKAELIEANPKSNKYFVTLRLDNGFQLLAVWTQAGLTKGQGYIHQLWQYLKANESTLDWDNLIVVGDWNSNANWDAKRKVGNHTDVSNFLSSKGLLSCYHAPNNILHGQEQDPTFYMYRNLDRPYHIDYMFAPGRYLSGSKTLTIGTKDRWLSLSDHLPISFNFQVDREQA